MIYETKEVILRDGTKCILRNPSEDDAIEMINFLRTCATETNFILRYPEECIETKEEESKILRDALESKFRMVILAEIDGEIVGNCHLNIHKKMKVRHRGDVAIVLVSKVWDKGIGTIMFGELEKVAREQNCKQLELEFIEGNDRALAFYKKLGYSIYGERKRGIILKDGSTLSEFFMVKFLD